MSRRRGGSHIEGRTADLTECIGVVSFRQMSLHSLKRPVPRGPVVSNSDDEEGACEFAPGRGAFPPLPAPAPAPAPPGPVGEYSRPGPRRRGLGGRLRPLRGLGLRPQVPGRPGGGGPAGPGAHHLAAAVHGSGPARPESPALALREGCGLGRWASGSRAAIPSSRGGGFNSWVSISRHQLPTVPAPGSSPFALRAP